MYYPNPPRVRDYTTSAILILLLYFLGWAPGFIFNLVKLVIAAFEIGSYDRVEGLGCLVWLLFICGFGGLVLMMAFMQAFLGFLHI